MTAWRTMLPTGVDDLIDKVMVSEQEFRSFMAHLQQILDASGVPTAQQAELKAIVESTRGSIVDPAGAKGPSSASGAALA